MKKMKLNEIENAVYGEEGLFARVVKKIYDIGIGEASKVTGKKRQQLYILIRQFREPKKFTARPKLDSIKELAEKLGIE